MKEPIFEVIGPDGHRWELCDSGEISGFPAGSAVINKSVSFVFDYLEEIKRISVTREDTDTVFKTTI
jgi:hypothetical protein